MPVSAAEKRGLEELASAISAVLPEQSAIYPEDMLMDSTERFLASEVIREKIFRHTDEEVPHGVASPSSSTSSRAPTSTPSSRSARYARR